MTAGEQIIYDLKRQIWEEGERREQIGWDNGKKEESYLCHPELSTLVEQSLKERTNMIAKLRIHTLLRRILAGTLSLSACAAAAFTGISEAAAQDPAVTQEAATKTTVTAQDGSILSCDFINNTITNCEIVQAAPQPVQAEPQPVADQQTLPDQAEPLPVADQQTLPVQAEPLPMADQQAQLQPAPQQPQVVYVPAPQPQPQVIYLPAPQQQAAYPGANGQPIQTTTSDALDGHFFAGIAFGYMHSFFTGMKEEYKAFNGEGSISNSYASGFFMGATAGYAFKYFGFFTSLDIAYGWGSDDFKKLIIAGLIQELGGYEVDEDEIKFTMNPVILNWSIGLLLHYSNTYIDSRFLWGLGVANSQGKSKIEYRDKSETVDMDEDNFFSMKFTLELDFRIGEHFQLGPTFSWIYMFGNSNDDYEDLAKELGQKSTDFHLLLMGLNFLFSIYPAVATLLLPYT